MAIDIRNENVISLAQAAKLKWLPRRRKGCRPHVATFYRWCQRGIRGEKLESIRCGGTICTSEAAILRFFDRLSARDGLERDASFPSRERSIEQAECELENLGV